MPELSCSARSTAKPLIKCKCRSPQMVVESGLDINIAGPKRGYYCIHSGDVLRSR